ncbi:MAG: DNA repair protein RadC [Pseudomonadota bacterium]
MTIEPTPGDDRPREKLSRLGAASLTESELLAIVLQTGAGGRSALQLAKQLLAAYGGLRQLLQSDTRALQCYPGIGRARSALIKAVQELSRRYVTEKLPVGRAIGSPADTKAYFSARLRDFQHEVFCCLYLDNRHRVLRFEELFRGTIDGTSVYPREVVKQALKYNAAAIIVAHNHPSGVAEPSQADERITRRLSAALALVDIRLLDHIVVGDGQTTSLAGRGVI